MSSIHLTTFIAAKPQRIFDLARSVSVYKSLFAKTRTIFKSNTAGNLMLPGEGFSVQITHLKKTRFIELELSSLDAPHQFILEQKKGNLLSFKHHHHIRAIENGSLLIDKLEFGLPTDLVGKAIGKFYLQGWIENFLEGRNQLIRQYAESEKWKMILDN